MGEVESTYKLKDQMNSIIISTKNSLGLFFFNEW